MFDKLEALVTRFEEIMNELGEAGAVQDPARFQKLMKEQSDLQPIVDAYKEYRRCQETVEDSLSMLEEEKDEEMRAMLKEELSDARERISSLEHELKLLLLPKDPNDEKNVIVEIRAGAGGDEAALFASDIYRMYVKYAENRGWRTELMSINENGLGGFKEATFLINGRGAYSRLKYESGVHRVQRVPATESQGRLQTSTATVAVLPEAEEADVKINPNDVRVDVMRAGGPGGQCVNTTDSAVRLTHIPTGIVVIQQDQKSQIKNKEKAWQVLRARLFDLEQSKIDAERSSARKSMVGNGDRSEKIRTYNYPQDRITDHRINLSVHNLPGFMMGNMDEMLDALNVYAKEEAFKDEA